MTKQTQLLPHAPQLSLLNGFSIVRGARDVLLPLSVQRLVAFLALHERPVLRSYIAGTLWPDSTEEHAHASLRTVLWRLCQPGLDIIKSSRTHLQLDAEVIVDVHAMVLQAKRLIGSPRECEPDDLDVGLLSSELLPGWYDDWAILERERLDQLRLHALEALCEHLITLGRLSEAVQAGLAAVRTEPLRESAQRALIRAYLAGGNRGKAMRQHARYSQLLFEELGVQPSPYMEKLVSNLMAHNRTNGL